MRNGKAPEGKVEEGPKCGAKVKKPSKSGQLQKQRMLSLLEDRNIQFYTVDTFEGDSGSTDKKEVEAYKQVNVSKMYEEFKENTKHLEDKFTTMVNYSYEAADYFLDNSVDQIFIDAGHSYEAVIKDIQAWYPKMKNGSIIAGHDYNSWEGVKKAVNELLGTPDKVENDCWFIKIKK